MAFLTFRGGIHPYDGKDLSKTVLLRSICRKEIWQFLFLSTSELRPKPIVKKGDHVLAGQKIAEAGGFVSAPIHSSVSGTVKGIEKRLTAVGAMEMRSSLRMTVCTNLWNTHLPNFRIFPKKIS